MEAGSIDEGMSPAPAPEGRPVLRAVGRGGRAGLRWASFFALPLAIFATVLGLVMPVFGLTAGQGFTATRPALGAAGFYGVCELYGLVIGGVVGLVGALIRRRRGASAGAPGWWRLANRPVVRIASRGTEGEPPSRSSVWFRRQRILVRVLVVVGVVVLAVAGGLGALAGRVAYRRLGAAIAAADADDPNWRLDDLMAARAEVPDEANSALVVAEVVTMLPEGWPPQPLAGPDAPLTAVNDRINPPMNAARLDDAAVAAARAALDDYAAAVALARTLAGVGPGRHELEIRPNPLETRLPATQASRDVARLLCSDVAVLAHDGRIDEALDSCRAILGVGRSIGDEPFQVSGLVRVAISTVGLQSARRALSQGEATDVALARLQADVLADLGHARAMLVGVMRGERATFDALIRRVRDGELPISALSGDDKPVKSDLGIASWGHLLFDAQRGVGLDWLNQLITIAGRPVAARGPLLKAWDAEIRRVKDSKVEMWGAILPLLMMPAAQASMTAHARSETELGALAVLLAAERHRLKHGDWPDSVAAIDPEFLAEPPVDPFTGEPFLIERGDGQFLVHSVGPNGKDEHGADEPRKLLQGGPDDFGAGAWDADRRRRPPEPPATPGEVVP